MDKRLLEILGLQPTVTELLFLRKRLHPYCTTTNHHYYLKHADPAMRWVGYLLLTAALYWLTGDFSSRTELFAWLETQQGFIPPCNLSLALAGSISHREYQADCRVVVHRRHPSESQCSNARSTAKSFTAASLTQGLCAPAVYPRPHEDELSEGDMSGNGDDLFEGEVSGLGAVEAETGRFRSKCAATGEDTPQLQRESLDLHILVHPQVEKRTTVLVVSPSSFSASACVSDFRSGHNTSFIPPARSRVVASSLASFSSGNPCPPGPC